MEEKVQERVRAGEAISRVIRFFGLDYGTITLHVQAGRLVHIGREETFKPLDLASIEPGERRSLEVAGV